jgi:hypothetical protein
MHQKTKTEVTFDINPSMTAFKFQVYSHGQIILAFKHFKVQEQWINYIIMIAVFNQENVDFWGWITLPHTRVLK